MNKYEPNGLFEGLFQEAVEEELNDLHYTKPVKLLKDFTAKELKQMEKLYKAKIVFPSADELVHSKNCCMQKKNKRNKKGSKR